MWFEFHLLRFWDIKCLLSVSQVSFFLSDKFHKIFQLSNKRQIKKSYFQTMFT